MKFCTIKFGDGYLAMRWSGFLFWGEWKPNSWELHPTREGAAKEIEDTEFYLKCKGKSGAV